MQVRRNREILKRLIDLTVLLAKQELAFRGHDEREESNNKGNFVEFLNFMATKDPELKNHLESDSVFKGTSKHIQNDIISSIAGVLKEEVKTRVKNSPFASIICDESVDIAKFSQACIVLRYLEGDEVVERFVGFEEVSLDRSAEALKTKIVKI